MSLRTHGSSSWFRLLPPDDVEGSAGWSSSSSSSSSGKSAITLSPPTPPLSLPFLANSRTSSTSRALALVPAATRRLLLLACALALPILGLLLVTEMQHHDTLRAVYAAGLMARDGFAHGSMDLAAWRARLSSDGENADWPSWWGSSDDVGPSPFDHIPTELEGPKRRMLFLTDFTDYLERMNTHTYEIVDAALRHPHLIVDVWGPGWAGYDWSVPLSINVKRRANRVAALEKESYTPTESKWIGLLPKRDMEDKPAWDMFDDGCNDDVRYDIVWTISDIYKKKDMPHVDPLDCGALLVQQLGDCHSHRCMVEWYPQANNITVTKYAFELEEVFGFENVRKHYPDFQMGLFGHSPDTANEWDFWPLPWDQRDTKAAIFGFDGVFYPIRTTITDHLRRIEGDETKTSPISRFPHPGYTVHIPDETRQNPLETYEIGHETYETHRNLRANFASGMRRAQICVFDSSLERKLIRKYAQAFLSGCVVATDLPTEHEEALAKVTIPLEPTWGIEKIEEQINAYLAQPEKLHQMSMDAFAYARKHLTTTAKISSMLKLADQHRAGHRGYDHAYSFSSRCRSYWNAPDSQRPPWCRFEDGFRGLEDVLAPAPGEAAAAQQAFIG